MNAQDLSNIRTDQGEDRRRHGGVQVHGGAGSIRGVAVERFYRDARLFRIYEGTSQIQQVIIARSALRPASRA